MPFHEAVRLTQRRETELRVKTMRIASRETPATQSLQIGMLQDAFQKEFCQSKTSMILSDENVCEICKRRTVSDHASKPNLSRGRKHAEAQRILYRPKDHF